MSYPQQNFKINSYQASISYKENQIMDLIKTGLAKRSSTNKEIQIAAIKYYEQALQIDSQNIEALYFKTISLIDTTDNINSAYQIIKDVGRSLGNYLRVASLKTIAMNKFNFNDEDLKTVDLAIIKHRDQVEEAIDFQIVGHSYRLTCDLENAEVYYKKAIELSSNTVGSYAALGRIYYEQEKQKKEINKDKLETAAKLLEHAVSISKYNADNIKALIECYMSLGFENKEDLKMTAKSSDNFKQAVKYCKVLTEVTDKTYIKEANAYYQFKDYQLCITTFTKCIEEENEDMQPYEYSTLSHAYHQLAQQKGRNDPNYIDLMQSALLNVTIAYGKYKHADFDKRGYDEESRKFITNSFVLKDLISLELNAQRHEVSHAIKHNDALESQEGRLNCIKEDPSLKNYYESFRLVIDKYFTAALVANSGRFAQEKPMVFGVVKKASALVSSIPAAEFVINAVNKVAEMAYVISRDNKDKYLLSELGYFEEAQRIAKTVAIEVTMQKAARIISSERAAAEDPFFRGLMTKFKNLKAKVCVDLTNTPEKVLAYKDAAIMIKMCQLGSVAGKAGTTPEEKFIAAIMLAEERLQWNEQAKEVKKLDAKVKKMNSDKKLLAMSPPPAAANENATKSPIKTLQKFGSPGVKIADKAIDAYNDKAEIASSFSEIAEKFPDLHLDGFASKSNSFVDMLGGNSLFDS